MSDQKPSVGRIVHYVSYGTPGGEYTSQCRSATITEVGAWVDVEATEVADKWSGQPMRRVLQHFDPEACALMVSNPTGLFFNTCQHYEAYAEINDRRSYKGGTWHWPERV